MMYVRMFGVVVALAVLGYTHFWAYNKGKDSVFKGVLAGVATSQKEDNKDTEEALARAEALGKQLATLEGQKNELVKRLKASVKDSPRVECQLSADELRSLQDAANSTRQ